MPRIHQQVFKKLGKAVKDARTKRGLSQEKLAEILNLDSRTILNIEAGRGNPKFEILAVSFPLSNNRYLSAVLIVLIIHAQKYKKSTTQLTCICTSPSCTILHF